MKIQETITRDCCDKTRDLKPYNGILYSNNAGKRNIKFCMYCGQIWFDTVGYDSHGGEEYSLDVLRLSL